MVLLQYALVVFLLLWVVCTVCMLGFLNRCTRVFSMPAFLLMYHGCVLVALLLTVLIIQYGPSDVYDAKPWLPEASWLAKHLIRPGG